MLVYHIQGKMSFAFGLLSAAFKGAIYHSSDRLDFNF